LLAVAPAQFVALSPQALQLAVIVPTFNEGENVGPLVQRLAFALQGITWEAIFVDDGSTDDTVSVLTSIALVDPRVRLIRRVGRRGLSTAVVEGMLASVAPVLAVIDADLQHDERLLPKLLKDVTDNGADIAVGTRYADGGSTGSWQHARLRMSRFATSLAAKLLRVRLSDPMSGFFAIRRDAFLASLPNLSSLGYKIMLDIVASAPRPLAVREEPYQFRPRLAGKSKLDAAIAFEYALLLADKTIGHYVPLRLMMFLGVGALGLVVNLALLAILMMRIAVLGRSKHCRRGSDDIQFSAQ
jgi:dolichol-phosphate mannosyltransferase